MSVMTTLQVPGPWRVDDLVNLPDDGHRYEIVDGVLLVNAAPSPRHQRVQQLLSYHLHEHCPPHLWVMTAPLDVVLGDDTVVEPDILVAARAAFTDKNLPEPPLLAVEVLSPSTSTVDRNLKLDRYQRAGIPSYWLVDPDELRLIAFEIHEGQYRQVADVSDDETWTATNPFPVTIRPAGLLD